MNDLVLITGGAGFIGSHTADALLRLGYRIRVIDNLASVVHPSGEWPAHLAPEVERVYGDVCDSESVRRALDGVSHVYHFAAETGLGLSMCEIRHCFQVNVTGTAALWQAIRESGRSVRRVILSSSRAVYGEGPYECDQCARTVIPCRRTREQLLGRRWAPFCPHCGQSLRMSAVAEDVAATPVSAYGLTKKQQEEICLLFGAILNVPVVVLRYFNVYGSRQALNNPYTGLVANFFLRLKQGKPIVLYEEGQPVRDFVHVSDVVQANVRALTVGVTGRAFNVGTGRPVSLAEFARLIGGSMNGTISGGIQYTPRFRMGDIFGCFANLERARAELGYWPAMSLEQGITELIRDWLSSSDWLPEERSDLVEAELRRNGVVAG